MTLRLGYFPNVTHAPAIVGVEERDLREEPGQERHPRAQHVQLGHRGPQPRSRPSALDASYIGPSPTITAWDKLDKGVKIVSGAASGGAYFVVNQSINSAADLKGKAVASPQLGNTQDVALRTWLKSKGLNTDTTGGGDVQIRPQDNATTPERVQGRRARRSMGARAVGDAAGQRGRRQDPGRRGRPLAAGQVRHHAAHRHQRASSRNTPTSCRSWSTARSRRTTSSRPTRSTPRPTCRTTSPRSPASRSRASS